MIDFSMKELSELIKDLNIVTHIKCVLYDENFKPLYHYEMERSGFCSIIRSNPEYYERCIASDMQGFKKCTESGGACTYKCHMGLYETLTPIKSGGLTIGFILVGQRIGASDYEKIKKNIESFPEKDKRDVLYRELERVRTVTDEEIESMSRLVKICTSYIEMKKLVSRRDAPTKQLVEEYIAENIRYKIDIEALSRAFGMSKSSLYSFSVKNFGMGISEYVMKMRLEKAAELLLSEDLTVSEISSLVGIYDTNYFVKLFRKKYGLSPKKWKNTQK